MRREDHRLAFGHLPLVVHEHRPARLEVLDHVEVVDDLLADVDGGPVEVERLLDRLDRPLDAGAVAARRGEEDSRDHGRIVALPAGGACRRGARRV